MTITMWTYNEKTMKVIYIFLTEDIRSIQPLTFFVLTLARNVIEIMPTFSIFKNFSAAFHLEPYE